MAGASERRLELDHALYSVPTTSDIDSSIRAYGGCCCQDELLHSILVAGARSHAMDPILFKTSIDGKQAVTREYFLVFSLVATIFGYLKPCPSSFTASPSKRTNLVSLEVLTLVPFFITMIVSTCFLLFSSACLALSSPLEERAACVNPFPCNSDNAYRALVNPTRSRDSHSFCSYLGGQNPSSIYTATVSATTVSILIQTLALVR